jgi:hypothetical protein
MILKAFIYYSLNSTFNDESSINSKSFKFLSANMFFKIIFYILFLMINRNAQKILFILILTMLTFLIILIILTIPYCALASVIQEKNLN